jgi:O-antigen/teichoic acid export membrane protein
VLAAAYLVAALVHLYLVSSAFLRGHPFRFQASFCVYHLRAVAPFLLISLVSILDTQLSPIILSVFSSEAEVGIYGAALTVVNVLNLMPQAYRVAVFPLLSRTSAQSEGQLESVYARSLRYMLLASLPLAVGGIVLSSKIIAFLYEPAFSAAASVLPILLLAWLLGAINVVNTRVLIATHHQSWCAVNLSLGLGVNLGGSLLYVPRLGMLAAAGARLVASTGILAGTSAGVARFVGAVRDRMVVKPVLAAAVMAGVVHLVATWTGFHVVVVASIGAIVYMGVLLSTGAFDAEDRQVVAVLWQRLRGYGTPPSRA